MKRALFAALLVFLPALLNAQDRTDYRVKGAPIPRFVIEPVKGGVFTNTVLKPGKPVLLVIFSPQCEHCERALDTLKGMGARLKGTQIVLVTQPIHQPQMSGFLEKSGLGKNPAFRNMGVDRSNLIYSIYAQDMLPQFNIYDSKHRLVRTFSGIFPLDSLKPYLPPG